MRNDFPALNNREPRLRVTIDREYIGFPPLTLTANDSRENAVDTIPIKEWSVADDVLNISDAAAVTIANVDGENASPDKIPIGARVEIDESDPNVNTGEWNRIFTGRITSTESYSDNQGGSSIQIQMMDLGWHLTTCKAEPHLNLRNSKITIGELLRTDGKGVLSNQKKGTHFIDPSWGLLPLNIKDGNE